MNAIALRGSDLQRAVAQLNDQLSLRAEQFKMVLPSHISPEKFQRTLLTAAQTNPDLLTCDRQSLLNACMKAAQDGLLPDGREAALVKYVTRQKIGGQWQSVATVSYLPMVYGLRKKILQSEEVADIFAGVVYRQEIEAGRFIYEEGSERMLRHKPLLDPEFVPADEDVVLAYSVATFKDGSKSFEVMRRGEINKVRQVSQVGSTGRTDRQGNAIEAKGPWVEWFSEMAKKTVIRRHSKWLPMSSDIFVDVEGAEIEAAARSAVALLDSRKGGEPQAIEDHSDDLPPHNEDTGEIIDAAASPPAGEAGPDAEEELESGPATDEGEREEEQPVQVNDRAEPAATLLDEVEQQKPTVGEDPAAAKANEIIDALKAATSVAEVTAAWGRNAGHVEAMDEGLRGTLVATKDARLAEIKAGAQPAEAAE